MEITITKHSDTIYPKLKNIPNWIEVKLTETHPQYINKVVIDKQITFTLVKELHEYKCSFERDLSTDVYYIIEFIVDYLNDLIREASYIISGKTYFITPWELIKFPKTRHKVFLMLHDSKSHQNLLEDVGMTKTEFENQTEQYLNHYHLELQQRIEKERRLKLKKN